MTTVGNEVDPNMRVNGCHHRTNGADTDPPRTPTLEGSSSMTSERSYRFTITAHVESGHVAYDDPEWVADAAAGALKNEYGIECVYENIEEIDEEDE